MDTETKPALMVVHRQTQVRIEFAVHDSDGNHLFDYPLQAGTPSFGSGDWERIRSEAERTLGLLRAGKITDASQPLPPKDSEPGE